MFCRQSTQVAVAMLEQEDRIACRIKMGAGVGSSALPHAWTRLSTPEPRGWWYRRGIVVADVDPGPSRYYLRSSGAGGGLEASCGNGLVMMEPRHCDAAATCRWWLESESIAGPITFAGCRQIGCVRRVWAGSEVSKREVQRPFHLHSYKMGIPPCVIAAE